MTDSDRATRVSIWMLGSMLVLVNATSCASRSSGFDLENVQAAHWMTLKQIAEEVGNRYGFRSAHRDYLDQEVVVNGRWWILASYSNRGGGAISIPGGRAHVDFSILARASDSIANIVIIDYSNHEQTEYVRQIEDEFRRLISTYLPKASVAYTTHVVRTLPP